MKILDRDDAVGCLLVRNAHSSSHPLVKLTHDFQHSTFHLPTPTQLETLTLICTSLEYYSILRSDATACIPSGQVSLYPACHALLQPTIHLCNDLQLQQLRARHAPPPQNPHASAKQQACTVLYSLVPFTQLSTALHRAHSTGRRESVLLMCASPGVPAPHLQLNTRRV
jgi:hypothetical protein